MLVGLKLFYGKVPPTHKIKVTSWTDNRGNGSALNTLMTTRFPASAVQMELASHVKELSMVVLVDWAPTACNQEGDVLASGDASAFTPELRVPVDQAKLTWKVLPWALDIGRESEKLFLEPKKMGGLPNRTRKPKEEAS